MFLNGHTACLKTYTARRLSNVLHIPLVETNKFGSCTDSQGFLNQQLRDRRYSLALEVVSKLFDLHLSVVVDGTFSRQKWRTRLYSAARVAEITDIVILRCICPDEDIARLRMAERSKDSSKADSEASFHFENYRQTKEEEQSIWDDQFDWCPPPAIVQFDSSAYKVSVLREGHSPLATTVAETVWSSVHTGTLRQH